MSKVEKNVSLSLMTGLFLLPLATMGACNGRDDTEVASVAADKKAGDDEVEDTGEGPEGPNRPNRPDVPDRPDPTVPGEGEGEGEVVTPGEGEGEGTQPGEGEVEVPGEGEGEGEVVVPGEGEGEGEVVVPGEGEGEVVPPPPPTSTVWRPFNDSSPWNTPIPAGAPLAPDSAALVADFASSSPYGVHLDVNITNYSVPLYFADASTPTVQMTADVGGHGWGAGLFGATFPMPMPPGAVADPSDDGHIAVVDKARNLEWDCWASRLGSNSAGVCATTDLSGSGVRPRADQAVPWSDAHGARACGFPLVAGLIRPEEIAAGEIRHALVIAYPHIRAGFYTPPASTAQARVGDNSVSSRGIPCGGRMQLDPAIDVEALDATPAAKVIMRALQQYGAFMGDYSGALSIYADGSPDAQAAWQGVLDPAALGTVLNLSDLRVLQIGETFDNGNGG